MARIKNGMRPIHPGEVLREEFLIPMELSPTELARALKVPANRVTGIVNEKRAITADTALRLSRYFGTTAEFWMGLQSTFDLRTAEVKDAKTIRAEVSVRKTG
jgi:addiction module HigA family antidote